MGQLIQEEQSQLIDTGIKMSGARAVLEILLREEVEYIFGYPGGAIMPIYDELMDYQDRLKHILTRHEQGATHAAQGYARTSGKVGVCFATSGPGATNLITGIADAQIDSTPLVCITGQVSAHLLGTDAFQETNIIGISMPVTKWNYQVTSADEIPEVLAKAFYIAQSGRPGPVLIDITKNAQFDTCNFQYKKCLGFRSYIPVPSINDLQVKQAAEAINRSKKPLLLLGQGVLLANAESELKHLIEKADIPTAWTILGLSGLESDHPLNMGMLGMHGNYGPNLLTNECDLLIAVGMRFDDRVTGNLDHYAKQAEVVHIEIDPAEINKNVHADYPVLGDAKAVLEKLIPLVDQNDHNDWKERFKRCRQEEQKKVIEKAMNPTSDQLSMGEVMKWINQYSGGEAIVVTDVGQHQMVACRYAQFRQSKSSITSGGLGTMGFCLPAAIGAKLGSPDQEVVAIIGDGGVQMTIQELGTIMQCEIPIKVVILNNEFLGMVRQWQELFFDKRYSATEMMNPDFVKLAQAYNIQSERVLERDTLDAAVHRLMSSKESYVLEVMVAKENNVFPMVPTGASVSDIILEKPNNYESK